MCYIQPTNIDLEKAFCQKCNKKYVLCPCCGEPVEVQGKEIHPIPIPTYPTQPDFPKPWRRIW